MEASKPVIFVSHAATDAEIATEFKTDVERNFLGLCDVFVSSNLESIDPGQEWVRKIKSSMQVCKVLIGLISPIALTRGWVYFEFGAAWVREIPAIPICHSGLTRNNLPLPLSVFQALNLSDGEHLRSVYRTISENINCNTPSVDFNSLSARYFAITEPKRISNLLREWFKQIIIWNPELTQVVDGTLETCQVLIPMHLEPAFVEFRDHVEQRRLLVIQPQGMGIGTRIAAQASIFQFTRGERASDIPDLLAESKLV
jgi:hypothetical protein